MTWLRKLNAFNRGLALNVPDEGAGGGAAPDAGSILFPDDQANAGGDEKPAETAGDEKPAEDKAEGDKPAEDKPAGDADQVPADGKYALTMPDGVELDADLADALGPEFKDLGLTNAQAQKLVDKYIETQQARAGKQGEAFAQTVQGWADTAKADKEIGGAKWDTTVAASQRAVKTLGTPELREYLNASGGGNHPELIRFMAKVGAMISEDDPAAGGAAGQGKPAEAAYTLFPSDAPKG